MRQLIQCRAAAFALALLLALSMSACAGRGGATASTPASTTTNIPEATTQTSANTQENTDTPLVMAYGAFSNKFSPFAADTAYDQDVVAMTQVSLLTTDREGQIVFDAIDGETRPYNGMDYHYTGIADLEVDYDETADMTTYTARLRKDVRFSDGEYLDADDLIFTYYCLLDPSYVGSNTLSSYPIVGLKEYRTDKSVSRIAGITRIDDHTVTVDIHGYEAPAVYAVFDVSVVPMHYYGDETLYDPENGSFGFAKGDLSGVLAKTAVPMGAGPYTFVEYTDKKVYFEANPHYYRGEPKTRYVQFIETATADVLPGLTTGTADGGMLNGTKNAFEAIRGYNTGGALSGDMIFTSSVENLGYGYIGMNADTVNVGGEPDSEASLNLRRALATVIAVYRDVAIDSYYGDAASVIQYPISNTSWAAPRPSDPDYRTAFSVDVEGKPIYTADMDEDAREKAALDAAVGFLKAAGYTWDDAAGRFTAAPEGAALEYELIIPADGTGDHPCFMIVSNARQALERIGITLLVRDPADSSMLWDKLDAGNQQLWVAAWGATVDPDLYQIYHSAGIVGRGGSDSNHYHIASRELDELILRARASDDREYRRLVYKSCLDIISDWAVEIPIYQRKNIMVFSQQHVDMTTVTPEMTTFWGWMNDIENLKMR